MILQGERGESERQMNNKLKEYIQTRIKGTCVIVSADGGLVIDGAKNTRPENIAEQADGYDTVICYNALHLIGPERSSMDKLMKLAKRTVIIIAPAYSDRAVGKVYRGLKYRYYDRDFTGFDIKHFFPGFKPVIVAEKNIIPGNALSGHKISVFVPIFNEEKIIDRDIKSLDYMISKLPMDHEIFIVNDASTDKTKAIAAAIEKENKNIKLLNYTVGPTRRENLAQSFKHASGDIVAFVDIDLLSSLRFFEDLVMQVALGYDIATGSRYVRGAKIKRKAFRLFISHIYNFVIRLVFRTHMADHMCGFKAFKKDVIVKLVDEMGYDTSLERGIFWDTEMFLRALDRGYKIKEIPIWWNERNKTALYFKRESRTIGYIISFMVKYYILDGRRKK